MNMLKYFPLFYTAIHTMWCMIVNNYKLKIFFFLPRQGPFP